MPPLTRAEYDAVLLAVSWCIGFAPLLLFRKRLSWVQCVGIALVASPFVRYALGIYLSIDALFTYEVLQPAAQAALWSSVQTRLFEGLVVPAVGLYLIHRGERLHAALQRHNLAPRRSWSRDALRGLALFFAIAIAYLAALGLSRTVFAPLASGGDESAYWRNLTIPLILLLAASAGLVEEFLFRGILLSRLAKWMPWGVAALAQAVAFGFIHAGYGTWLHVVGPLVFGLGMAWVARVLGVLPAALLHAEVNVLFFTLDVAPTYIAAHGLAGALALGGLLAAWAVAGALALWATRADAVRLLWRSLRGRFREVPEEPDGIPAGAL